MKNQKNKIIIVITIKIYKTCFTTFWFQGDYNYLKVILIFVRFYTSGTSF